jgi:hypothetical protein
MPTKGFLLLDPRDLFSGTIKGGYLPLGIDGEDTIRNAVKNDLCLIFKGLFHV